MLSRLRTWPWIIFDLPKKCQREHRNAAGWRLGQAAILFSYWVPGWGGADASGHLPVFVDGNQHKVCKPKKSDFQRLETRESVRVQGSL